MQTKSAEKVIKGLDKVRGKLVDLVTEGKLTPEEYAELSGYLQDAIKKVE